MHYADRKNLLRGNCDIARSTSLRPHPKVLPAVLVELSIFDDYTLLIVSDQHSMALEHIAISRQQ